MVHDFEDDEEVPVIIAPSGEPVLKMDSHSPLGMMV